MLPPPGHDEQVTPTERSDSQDAAFRAFLARHGLWPGEAQGQASADAPSWTLARLPGGANNAVFRVDVPAGVFLLKQYFAHPDDDRDRFGAEVAFCRLAQQHGIRTGPQLWASCREQRLALFEFIRGRPVTSADMDAGLIEQAVRFCRQLQDIQGEPDAAGLPLAAESCFSIEQHLTCVDRRIRRLRSLEPRSELDHDVLGFVRGRLGRRWSETRADVLSRCHTSGIAPEEPLPRSDWILSPSDFGFHNALLDDRGRVRFFDFEYAGWDDPAKLVCDFFCQVELPVPRSCLREFARGVVERLPGRERALQRIGLLLSVYQIKWCCIVLNEFLPEVQARRRFSSADRRPDRQPAVQWQKARTLLDEAGPIDIRSVAD